jgi:hypothetical protein
LGDGEIYPLGYCFASSKEQLSEMYFCNDTSDNATVYKSIWPKGVLDCSGKSDFDQHYPNVTHKECGKKKIVLQSNPFIIQKMMPTLVVLGPNTLIGNILSWMSVLSYQIKVGCIMNMFTMNKHSRMVFIQILFVWDPLTQVKRIVVDAM